MRRYAGAGRKGLTARRIKESAFAAIEESDLSDLFDLLGTQDEDRTASAALKTILAERITEYAMKAMKEARKRRTKLGAATLIIAAGRRY